MKRLLIKGLLTIIMSTMCMNYSTMSAHGAGTINDNVIEFGNIQIYTVYSPEDFEEFKTAVEHRNGKFIIELLQGTVIDSEGNGLDCCGYYTHYDNTRFSEGDKIQTVFVYNPFNNYLDDIVSRYDTIIR